LVSGDDCEMGIEGKYGHFCLLRSLVQSHSDGTCKSFLYVKNLVVTRLF
jgi:hypothetical protein